MRFVSTRKKSRPVSFQQAILQGLAPDGGLYMPEAIPQLPEDFWNGIPDMPFTEIAFRTALPFVRDEIPAPELRRITEEAFSFDAPLIPLDGNVYVMELFHGPTLAFKDFGARFMARVFAGLRGNKEKDVYILVATSGDTGSAVAYGFRDVPGVRVCLLYPRGKVSHLQEQQLTTAGGNVTAIEVDGTFDDCQKLVKQAFSDADLRKKMILSSANSINFARLLPQSFYYIHALAQLKKTEERPPVFSVPSGNMGNLTGGLLAMQMGMPAEQFIVATNVNDVVPEYLRTGVFSPRSSIRTISNAMDVGDPSNLSRIRYLFADSMSALRRHLQGYSFNDEQTKEAIRWVHEQTGYVLDPHTAVGYLAGEAYRTASGDEDSPVILMSTAHPAKFKDIVEPVIGRSVPVPARLEACLHKEKQTVELPADYTALRTLLVSSHEKVPAED